MGVGGIWLLTWFYTIQYLRYLIPCIILLSAVVGYLYAHWVCRNWFTRIAAQITMVSGLLYSSVICLTWILPCIPVVSGLISEDEYLRATLPAYAIAQYINSYLPRSAKLVTYGEPLCYYFEREYIWGDPGHNLLIDYDAVARSQNPLVALFRAYRKLNVTHVLVNRRFFRFDSDAIPNRLLARAMQIGILKWKVTMGVEELYEISWDVVRHEFNSKGGD
ncbi:MAG TPA: hypothetical protein EYP10_14180, partial [Armatimonadetes bacterium]|nr:hypothetical protein [Armatimonadota bacterium]